MAQKRRLGIYFGPDDSRSTALDRAKKDQQGVELPLGDLVDTLADGSRNQRIWIEDFRHEKVAISTDLYEVILAYQHYKRPSA